MFVKIGVDTYRETRGFFYEDFLVGDVYEHRPGRTITETDNTWLTLILMNQHPGHIDKEFSKEGMFEKVLVNSAITFVLVNGLTVNLMSYNCSANLGWDNVRFTGPVFVGDTLYANSKVLSARPSKSIKGQGVVSIRTEGVNQTNNKIMICERTFLIPFRNGAIKYDLPISK